MKMFVVIFFIFFNFFLANATVEYKYVTNGGFSTGVDKNPSYKVENKSLETGFQYIVNLLIGISIAIAVVLLAMNGVLQILKRFNAGADIFGKKYKPDLLNPIVGLVIILSAWVILNTLNPDILKLNLFKDITLGGSSTSGNIINGAGN